MGGGRQIRKICFKKLHFPRHKNVPSLQVIHLPPFQSREITKKNTFTTIGRKFIPLSFLILNKTRTSKDMEKIKLRSMPKNHFIRCFVTQVSKWSTTAVKTHSHQNIIGKWAWNLKARLTFRTCWCILSTSPFCWGVPVQEVWKTIPLWWKKSCIQLNSVPLSLWIILTAESNWLEIIANKEVK